MDKENKGTREWVNKGNRAQIAENRMYERFTELMIKRIQDMKEEGTKTGKWEMPWIPSNINTPESIYGKRYHGSNALMLTFLMMSQGYKIPIFATFDYFHFMGYKQDKDGKYMLGQDKDGNRLPQVYVNKGEKGFPIYLMGFKYYNSQQKKSITQKEYDSLGEDEKQSFKKIPFGKVYQVFNVEQTNLATARPELWQSYIDKYTNRDKYNKNPEVMYANEPLDRMVKDNLYICPIHCVESNSAYYNITNNYINLPLKEQFKNGEHYYSTMLHEMAHATGQKALFDRFGEDKKAYAREELVAELTSAFVAAQQGISKPLSDEIREDLENNNAHYLMSWLGSLQEDPNFLKTVLADMKKASDFIEKKIDATIKLTEAEKEGKEITLKELGLGPLSAKQSNSSDDSEEEEEEGQEEHKSLKGADFDGDGEIEAEEQNEEKEKQAKRHR